MDESNFYSDINNFLSPQYDIKEKPNHFPLDINDSFCSSLIKDKYFSTENNDIDDNKFNQYDYKNIFDEEKSKANNNNDKSISILNNEEMKRQLKLKRKRESAKEGRLRKKLYIDNLINQLKELQIQNSILLKIISKCSKCKEEYEKERENENKKNNKNKDDYILRDKITVSNKTKLLFMTAITLLSIFNLFNIFCFNQGQSKLKNKRNLSTKYKSDVLINKIKSPNGDEALFIHLAEYFSLTTREKVERKNNLDNQINKNIKIYDNNKFNINEINQTNIQYCVKCVVEIDKNSIKMGGDEFTFYLVERLLSNNFINNLEDGIFPELNFEKENEKSDDFSKVFALKCKIIGYSINNIYSDKIGTIS